MFNESFIIITPEKLFPALASNNSMKRKLSEKKVQRYLVVEMINRIFKKYGKFPRKLFYQTFQKASISKILKKFQFRETSFSKILFYANTLFNVSENKLK